MSTHKVELAPLTLEGAQRIVKQFSFQRTVMTVTQPWTDDFELCIAMMLEDSTPGVEYQGHNIRSIRRVTIPVHAMSEVTLVATIHHTLRQMWQHEFDEWFKRKGVRVRNPHRMEAG